MRPILIALALLLPACSTVAPYKLEHNVAVGIAPHRAGYIVLQEGQFGCPKGLRRAFYVEPPTAGIFAGCWAEHRGVVVVEFEDGEQVILETAVPDEQPQRRGA